MNPALRELVRWLTEHAIAEVTATAHAGHAATSGPESQLPAAPARHEGDRSTDQRPKAAPRRRSRKQ